MLGMPVKTDPSPELMLEGQFPRAIEGASGIAGPWAAAMFRELDLAFANSKFILTVRTPHEWVECMLRPRLVREQMAPEALYGSARMDRTAMLAAYELHKAAVLAHFVGREEDLLVMDLYDGEQWDELCPFIGARLPRRSFPMLTRSQEAAADVLTGPATDLAA